MVVNLYQQKIHEKLEDTNGIPDVQTVIIIIIVFVKG